MIGHDEANMPPQTGPTSRKVLAVVTGMPADRHGGGLHVHLSFGRVVDALAVLVGVLAALAGSRGIHQRVPLMVVAVVATYVGSLILVEANVLPEQSQERLARFLHLGAGTAGGGRDRLFARQDTWVLGLRGYVKSGLVGTGFGATGSANQVLVGSYHGIHSNVLGSPTEWNPVRFLLFAGLHLALVRAMLGMRDVRLGGLAFIVVASCLVLGAAHTSYVTKWFWLPMLLIMCMLGYDAIGSHSGWTPEEENWREALPPGGAGTQ